MYVLKILVGSHELKLMTRMICAVNPSLDYSLYAGFVHLAAGLSCGFTGLAAGYAIGIVGDSVRTLSSVRHFVY